MLGQLGDQDTIKGLPFLRADGLLYMVETDGRRRLCIPATCAREVIADAHERHFHAGRTRLWQDLSASFAIPRLSAMIDEFYRQV
ncbi:hypothetical protein XA68_11009 [Ophiocordyceps unilateralis]|uniref:Integrase zinc-binding domain-containing protein n=1 Tax=Ophiocordyceps unilateralis TaxID=268505 RepID=A0A2A9PHC2_OPHUN|nr:hypothetical protein XA68_11009 [Ophiocordyceps unilateralis]